VRPFFSESQFHASSGDYWNLACVSKSRHCGRTKNLRICNLLQAMIFLACRGKSPHQKQRRRLNQQEERLAKLNFLDFRKRTGTKSLSE
jgi:hypothetical protein